MPCYHPLAGWRSRNRSSTGRRGVVFRLTDGYADEPVEVPCGRCIGCRLERSRQWALRCVHESKLHVHNAFVTLTYSEVPAGGSLRPKDFVDFMKRLRHVRPGVRFFQAGEYGEQLSRPHHHAILFNCRFPDRKFLRMEGANRLDESRELERLWGHGFVTVGEATFESAAYVARYVVKKVTGPGADEHYQGRHPEYCTMSRRPGIGRGFLERFGSDVYPSDECIVRGKPCKPPRYYDKVLEKDSPRVYRGVKRERRKEAAENPDNSGSRLVTREAVKEASLRELTRKLERA